MNRLDRALGILLLLRGGKAISATDLSERFEVSTRTIYRDIETLSSLGVPVYAEKGRAGGFRLVEGYFLPPVMFSVREAISLVLGLSLLRNLRADVLSTPEMTGEWESRLKQMAHGKLDRKHFMGDIRELTREIVEKVRNFRGETIEGEYATIDAKCPNCGGGPIKEDYKTFRCQNCDWLMWKTMASRQFDPDEVRDLLTSGRVGPLQGFRSKMGRPFTARVKLGEEFKPQFEFENNDAAGAVVIDPARHEALGICPICHKGQVYALDNSYACEHAVAAEKTCTFRVGKVILQREIPKEQVQKLIATGKTDLLPKFISKKGRPFSAHLKLDKGKVGFEFAEKAPKTKKPPVRKAVVAET
jgi:DNA topoisomerase-3